MGQSGWLRLVVTNLIQGLGINRTDDAKAQFCRKLTLSDDSARRALSKAHTSLKNAPLGVTRGDL